jgi:hypothetical protein
LKRVRTIRPQRKPIFIGCEGESEMGYAAWLRNLVRDRGLPFALKLSDLGRGAGDPLTRVSLAIDRLHRLERNRERFVARFIFLDTDQLQAEPQIEQRSMRLAKANNIVIIWQQPTHEAFLLRHFAGRETHRPPTKQASDAALAKEWPAYGKPCSASELENHITLDGAVRVAEDLPELATLLRTIRLM